MLKREIKKYTDAFKKMVLDELEMTNSSYADLTQKYEIGGSMTIKKWIIASGRTNLLHPVKIIGVQNEVLQ